MAFEATPPTGVKFVMDAYPESGGTGQGPTPMEAFVSSMAACTAMDVIDILHKKRQTVSSYRVEIDGDRATEGEYPRPYTSITITHIVNGENLDPAAVERAVRLSDEKYCSAVATLRFSPKVESKWRIEEASTAH